MARLIDADALIESIKHGLWDWETVNGIESRTVLEQTIQDIRNEPTIEAEPVIKCKDCKFNYANQIPSDDVCQLCVELPISKDFFCAYGEKMDEVNDE